MHGENEERTVQFAILDVLRISAKLKTTPLPLKQGNRLETFQIGLLEMKI